MNGRLATTIAALAVAACGARSQPPRPPVHEPLALVAADPLDAPRPPPTDHERPLPFVILPPGEPRHQPLLDARVLGVRDLGGGIGQVVLDQGVAAAVGTGWHGWLVDDRGVRVPRSDFVIGRVTAARSFGTVRMLPIAALRGHARARLEP